MRVRAIKTGSPEIIITIQVFYNRKPVLTISIRGTKKEKRCYYRRRQQ